MLQPTCEHAVIEWPDGRRATLTSADGRASWRTYEDPVLDRLNFVLQSCYDRELSLEGLVRKCLAHEMCPPHGQLLGLHQDGAVYRQRTPPAVALSSGWY